MTGKSTRPLGIPLRKSMADAIATIDEQEMSRDLAREKLETLKASSRLQAVGRKASSGQSSGSLAENSASAVARQAYTRAWQLAEEGLQDFALSFADFMLLSGPATVVIFIIRLFGGNLFGGSGSITFREVSVPRIPGYSIPEGTYKAGKVFLIGIISGLIYSLILLLIVVLVNPLLIVQIGLCGIFGPLVNFFGSEACSL